MIQKCQHDKSTKDLLEDVSNYKTEAKTYKNKYGQTVAFNKALVFDNEKLIKTYLNSNDTIREAIKKFKKLNSVIKVKEYITIHDSIPYAVMNRIPCHFTPFQITRDSAFYYFKGTIAENYFKIDSLYIPNVQTVVLGTKKTGLFKKEFRAEITNSNPLITTTNVGSYVLKDKKKWYERPIFHLGVGIVIGFGANKLISNQSSNPF